MSMFQPPEGYVFDPASGRYYNSVIAKKIKIVVTAVVSLVVILGASYGGHAMGLYTIPFLPANKQNNKNKEIDHDNCDCCEIEDIDDEIIDDEIIIKITLNFDLLSLLGQTNARLKEVNGSNCYSDFWDGSPNAIYNDFDVLYPLFFWFDFDDFDEVFTLWGDDSLPYQTQNIWPDHLIVHGIRVWDRYLYYIFQMDEEIPLTMKIMGNRFKMVDKYFMSADYEGPFDYEDDVWYVHYVEDGYYFIVTFIEKNGEFTAFKANVYENWLST